MRIVFFGTPAFAVPSLTALLDEGAQVVGVVTQPDKPQGRSRSVLVPPPVKVLAATHQLPVLQPDRPEGDLFLGALKQWQPELGVVVAYGHLLRPELLALPPRGMINVHASLLPRWRGAAPIPWAILAGDPETGITIQQMAPGMDSGAILHQASTPIGSGETAGALTERLARLGADTLVEALALMQLGVVTPREQDPAGITRAPKVDRQAARLDWSADALTLSRRIRAFDPWPGAWTLAGGQELKLFGARPVDGSGTAGTILARTPRLCIAAGAGAVEVETVQPAGRSRMASADWSRGRSARSEAALG